MLITVKETKTEEKQVELQLPAYFVQRRSYDPDFVMACEDGRTIEVNSFAIIKSSENSSQRKIADCISEYLVSTEERFFEAYNRALRNIGSSVMPLPKSINVISQ